MWNIFQIIKVSVDQWLVTCKCLQSVTAVVGFSTCTRRTSICAYVCGCIGTTSNLLSLKMAEMTSRKMDKISV